MFLNFIQSHLGIFGPEPDLIDPVSEFIKDSAKRIAEYIGDILGISPAAQPEGILPNLISKVYDLSDADFDGNGIIDNTEALRAVVSSPYTYAGVGVCAGAEMYLNYKRKQYSESQDKAPELDGSVVSAQNLRS